MPLTVRATEALIIPPALSPATPILAVASTPTEINHHCMKMIEMISDRKILYFERCIERHRMRHPTKWDTYVRVQVDILPRSKLLLLPYRTRRSSSMKVSLCSLSYLTNNYFKRFSTTNNATYYM